MYSATVLADSVSPDNIRLVTLEVTMPRFLLPEFNTHRMLSRNSASSRAIPTEKLIHAVRHDAFVPEFNTRVKGMGVGTPLAPDKAVSARAAWLTARNEVARGAETLVALDVDKSRVNRLLEPFMWTTLLVTATDWSNFFALRTDDAAQPEFRTVATMMKKAYDASAPWFCPSSAWHLPLVRLEELGDPIDYDYWRKVSTGRCARISYLTHDGQRDPAQDVALHDRLLSSRHLSPFEHPARPFTPDEWEVIREEQSELRLFYGRNHPEQVEVWCRQLEYCGNFKGWWNYRSEIPDQHDFSLIKAA